MNSSNILIISSNQLFNETMAQICSLIHYKTVLSESLIDAIQLISKAPFDYRLSIIMPELNQINGNGKLDRFNELVVDLKTFNETMLIVVCGLCSQEYRCIDYIVNESLSLHKWQELIVKLIESD